MRPPPSSEEYPFERLSSVGDLEKKLVATGRLTCVDNPFILRRDSPVRPPDARIDGVRRVLILAPAERGKTREALREIEKLSDDHTGRLTILWPRLPYITEPPNEDTWPRLEGHIILFWDEIDEAHAPTALMAEDAPPSGEPRKALSRLLEAIAARAEHGFTFIGTAREENLAGKLADLDPDDPNEFWSSFEIIRLPAFDGAQERELLAGVAEVEKLEVQPDACEQIISVNEGRSAETIVSFLQLFSRREDRWITVEDTRVFDHHAFSAWHENRYKPLVQESADFRAAYLALAYLRVGLGIGAPEYLLLPIAGALLEPPGRSSWLRRHRAERAIRELIARDGYLRDTESGPDAPDYQTRGLLPEVPTDAADAALARAIGSSPDAAECRAAGYELGIAGRPVPAETAFRRALQIDENDALTWTNLGGALRVQERHSEAEAAYRRAIEIDPDHASIWANLAIALERQERYDEAETAHRRVIDIDPNQARAWINFAVALDRQGRHEEAEAADRRAVEIDDKDAVAWTNLGVALERQGRYEEAEAAHRRALDIDANYAGAWKNLGGALGQQGRHEEAEAAHQRAVEIDENDAVAWYNLGVELARQGRYQEAEAALRRAVGIDGRFARAWSNLGVALEGQARYQEAEAAHRRALEIDEDQAEGWYNLGVVLHRQDRQREAEAAYRRVVEIDDEHDVAWHNLAALLEAQGRQREAEAAYRRIVELDDRNPEAWTNLGVAIGRQGRYDEAEAALRRAVELDESDAGAWYNLSIALENQGRYEETEAVLRRAVELDENDARAWTNLGVMLTRRGEGEEAEAAFRRAIQVAPGHVNAWWNLAVALVEQHRHDEALAALREAIRLAPEAAEVARLADSLAPLRDHPRFREIVGG